MPIPSNIHMQPCRQTSSRTPCPPIATPTPSVPSKPNRARQPPETRASPPPSPTSVNPTLSRFAHQNFLNARTASSPVPTPQPSYAPHDSIHPKTCPRRHRSSPCHNPTSPHLLCLTSSQASSLCRHIRLLNRATNPRTPTCTVLAPPGRPNPPARPIPPPILNPASSRRPQYLSPPVAYPTAQPPPTLAHDHPYTRTSPSRLLCSTILLHPLTR